MPDPIAGPAVLNPAVPNGPPPRTVDNGHAGHLNDAGGARPHVVVLGGGVCGLYAARTLLRAGAQVTVLDRFEVPGGLAAGHERGGNYYDFGVHQLHSNDEAIFDDIKQLMGERLIPVEKKALIRYGDGFRRYPLEFFDLISGVPPWTLARAVIGLLVQQARNRLRPSVPVDAEGALIQLYGRPLYVYFFRDFTHQYWGIPPTELSAAFVRIKMPRLSAVDVIKKVLWRAGLREDKDAAVESAVKEEVLWYSHTGAREMPLALAEDIRRQGGSVYLESTVVGLDLSASGDGVTAVRYERGGAEHALACDAVLSTIPLGALIRAVGDAAPPDVRTAAAELRHKPVAVYGLLVRKPRVLEAMHVYYRERIFHRLAEPANCGMTVSPPGHTVVLAELTCDVGDDRWAGGPATRQRIIADMVAEGLLAEDDIVSVYVLRDEYAYPVFALGFEPYLARVQGYVGGLANLRSTGRQGAFCYPNMHGAMRMGADAAQALMASLAAPTPAPTG
jgi:protoporphyrinogen oxidase